MHSITICVVFIPLFYFICIHTYKPIHRCVVKKCLFAHWKTNTGTIPLLRWRGLRTPRDFPVTACKISLFDIFNSHYFIIRTHILYAFDVIRFHKAPKMYWWLSDAEGFHFFLVMLHLRQCQMKNLTSIRCQNIYLPMCVHRHLKYYK